MALNTSSKKRNSFMAKGLRPKQKRQWKSGGMISFHMNKQRK
nr:MAG TPA: hypothetical protein [Caudoviricetes sp.]